MSGRPIWQVVFFADKEAGRGWGYKGGGGGAEVGAPSVVALLAVAWASGGVAGECWRRAVDSQASLALGSRWTGMAFGPDS